MFTLDIMNSRRHQEVVDALCTPSNKGAEPVSWREVKELFTHLDFDVKHITRKYLAISKDFADPQKPYRQFPVRDDSAHVRQIYKIELRGLLLDEDTEFCD